MSRAFFPSPSPQHDPFAPPVVPTPLWIEDPDRSSQPTPSDVWLELSVRWGTSVLLSQLFAPHADVFLAPQANQPIDVRKSKDGTRVDVSLPSDLLGESSVQLVLGQSGHARILVPAGVGGTYVERQGKVTVTRPLGELLSRGTPSREAASAIELPLLPDATFELEAFGFTIALGLVQREKGKFKGLSFDRSYASYLAMSLSTFGSLLAGLAYFTPPLGLGDESEIDKERLILVQHYLSALAQREQEAEREPEPQPDAAPGGEASAPAPGQPGEAGRPEAARAPARIAVKGPKDQPHVELSREELRSLAQNFGVIGMLESSAASDAPFSPFARSTAIGRDDVNARGNLWGLDIGEAAGQNGLYLSGNGIGGFEGPGTGVGISGVFSVLGTTGKCTPEAGKVCGFGGSVGRNGGTHVGKVPTMHPLQTEVNGHLQREVVQRIVRQNFGRFRFCYERGLAQNPSLEGRVGVRFVIDRAGAVSTASAEPGGIPDRAVASCVAQAFYGLSFPPPEGGIVTVTYPIMFSPS